MGLLPVLPTIMASRFLPAITPVLGRSLGLDPDLHPSAAFITTDQEHSLYVALDEATKHSPVEIVYARSLYAGRRGTPGPFSGEIMGVIAGPDPDCVEEGLRACVRCLEDGTRYQRTEAGGDHLVFGHVVSRLGEYLAPQAELPPGEAMAYLMAPPLEAMIALDAAMKAADVELARVFPPPTESNLGGGWLTGELYACEAARDAFLEAIEDIVAAPRRFY